MFLAFDTSDKLYIKQEVVECLMNTISKYYSHFRSEVIQNHIQSVECMLVLSNGIPSYQKENDQCVNGISKDGIIFESKSCGVRFSHATWQEPQVVKINGQSDLLVNINDRIVFLRLYNSDKVKPIKDLMYWSNIHLPDIKVWYQLLLINTLSNY